MTFEILSRPTVPSIPLVVHVPHSSIAIPSQIRQTICLNDDELKQEILCMTDWYTDRLFEGVVDLGGTLFVNRLSRLVVDPERFPDESQEVMAERGMGAVYTKTAQGRPLRNPLSESERHKLLDTYFHPYAKAFANVVARMLEKHGRCFILDGHSFPSAPLPYELRQQVERPHICLGTDAFHTPETMVRKVELLCGSHGVETARNRPFEGTYVPLRYWQKDPCVSSLMIEIRRDCYMNEQTGTETDGCQRMRDMMVGVMEIIRQTMEE